MANLFSQIPAQVLNKVYNFSDEDTSVAPKKKVRFYEKDRVYPKVIHEDSSTDAESVINIDDSFDEPTTNFKEAPKKLEVQYRDAIVGTETVKVECRTIGTQTDESLRTRPLDVTEDDMHRMNMQSYAPIRPMPRRRVGCKEPPLRIGLTLRGKKRKVFYPGEEDEGVDGA